MQEFIKARIKSLPPLSDTTVKIQDVCNDPNAGLAELSKVVQGDPMLTANILRSANSPLYGFSREITTIDHAVNLFGMVTVKGFALSAAMKNSFKIDLGAYGMNEGEFLDLCTKQAALAAGWLGRASDGIKRVCIPASFLLEIGKLIIASELAEQGKAAEFKQKLSELTSIDQVCELESEFVGNNSYEITAMVFDKWALDIDMVQSIEQLRAPKSANAQVLNAVLKLVNMKDEKPTKAAQMQAMDVCAAHKLDTTALHKAIARLTDA